MKQIRTLLRSGTRMGLFRSLLAVLALILAQSGPAAAQAGTVMLDLAAVDGVALTPDNITAFSVQSMLPATTEAEIRGTVRYRQSGHSFHYTFRTTLRPGLNRIDPGSVRPQYQGFSSAALKELFLQYKVLPQGTYQYCVSIQPVSASGEQIPGAADEQCLVKKSEDLFLINLVDPENNAKLYERNPVFTWIVNYPFASQLTYRIRVAEVKPGQNNVTAITRNNPVYAESNLPQTTTTYPVYGKPLELFQPYAWTVDAYFKGLLLGGAEPWRFTIVEDSELREVPRMQAFYEFEKHHGDIRIYAAGELKLKYITEVQLDSLQFRIADDKNNPVSSPVEKLPLQLGDNRIVLPLKDKGGFGHKKRYTLYIRTLSGKRFEVPFIYINPLYL